jgi:tetratricopeptide (TPR) repeat protein
VTAQLSTPEIPAPIQDAHQDEAVWLDPYDQAPAWREWLKMLLVLMLTGIAFLPALSAGWVWKDHDVVQLDETPSTFGGIIQHWTNLRMDEIYRPVAYTSYWIEYAAWDGAAPVWYHAVGIGFHLLNALLLWRILKRLEVTGAAWIVALFALHPVTVQSVTWVSQQPIVLSATFALMSMWLWLRLAKIEPAPLLPLTESEVPEWRRCATYLLCAGFFLLAILTEPAVCAFPLVMILVTRWKRGKLSNRQKLGIAPMIAAAAIVVGLVIWAQITRTSEDRWAPDILSRLLIAGRAIWFHLSKLVFPWPLVFVYKRWTLSIANLANWSAAIAVVGAAIFVYKKREKLGSGTVLAIACFLLLLLPSFLLLRIAGASSFVSDTQQYLAAISLIAIAGSWLSAWVERAKMIVSARYIFATVILAVLATMTWRQSSSYASAQGLWEQTLAHNPDSSVANYELGNLLLEKQKFDQAEKYLAHATALRPQDSQAMLQYGTVLERQAMQLAEKDRAAGMKKLEQAETLYRQWRERSPFTSAPVRCLAGIENLRGNRTAAIRLYENALAINPKDDIAENNLATALAREGRIDDALAHYEHALSINPKLVQAHLNMAGLLFGMRKNQDAFNHIEQALKADRSNFDAYMSAGGVCMQMKLFNDASRMFRRATGLRSDSPTAWNALGCSLAAQNHLDEAVECFGRALDLKPEYEDARANLASAKKQRG